MSENAESLLNVSGLKCTLNKEQSIFHNVTFVVREGDVLILQGKSGSGYAFLVLLKHALTQRRTSLSSGNQLF